MKYNRDRKAVDKGIEKSGNVCIVCGWSKKDKKGNTLLEGAHVKPFIDNKEDDKYSNIIALCPNHHKEFDCGNFYIDYENNILVFRDESDIYNNSKIKGKIEHIEKRYLIYRKYMFEKLK